MYFQKSLSVDYILKGSTIKGLFLLKLHNLSCKYLNKYLSCKYLSRQMLKDKYMFEGIV